MLYVLILYCSGICPDNLPAPDGALLFTSKKDCETVRTNLEKVRHKIATIGPHAARSKQTCAHLWADPKQLDRLYHLPLPQE